MISSLLSDERSRLLSLIQQIQAAGEVAPAYCWLTETSSTKGGKTYTYIVLVTQRPEHKPKSRSLGRPGSQNHRHWKTAIARREAIAELEPQLTILHTLIDRQTKAAQNINLAQLVLP